MSLLSAFNVGVSGIVAQGKKTSILSDNITNVGTVGYKASEASFSSFVNYHGGVSSASSGGGIASSIISHNTKQGTIKPSSNTTDLAIYGKGFFIVSSNTENNNISNFYTRAGNFSPDKDGNLRNTAGFFLKGVPIEDNNTDISNIISKDRLQLVNFSNFQNIAVPTTRVEMNVNLDANTKTLLGSFIDMKIDKLSANYHNRPKDILIPSTTPNVIEKGDGITISDGQQDITFTYGGISSGISIANNDVILNGKAQSNYGILGAKLPSDNLSNFFKQGETIQIQNESTGNVTFSFANIPDLNMGQFNSLETLSNAINKNAHLTSKIVDNKIHISPLDASESLTFVKPTNTLPLRSVEVTKQSVLGANSITSSFSDATIGDGIEVRVKNNSGNDFVYRYTYAGTSDPANRKFTNLSELANLLNSDSVNANISNGSLHIINNNVTSVSNYNQAGKSSFAKMLGLEFVDIAKTLELKNIKSKYNRFSNLQGLANAINKLPNVQADINYNMSSGSSPLKISTNDPLGVLRVTNYNSGVGATSNFIKELGVVNSVANIRYNPKDVTKNMASGKVQPNFSNDVKVFDALGKEHNVKIGYVKLGYNKWGVEIYDPVSKTVFNHGSIIFDSKGKISNIDNSLKQKTSISTPNGNLNTSVLFDFGDQNKGHTGFSQFASNYEVTSIKNNGMAKGNLHSVKINSEGVLNARFSNGYTRPIFKIPLAIFSNANSLQAFEGNVYGETMESGKQTLSYANSGKAGKLVQGLESSTTEVETTLIELMSTQFAHKIASKIVTTSEKMLSDTAELKR